DFVCPTALRTPTERDLPIPAKGDEMNIRVCLGQMLPRPIAVLLVLISAMVFLPTPAGATSLIGDVVQGDMAKPNSPVNFFGGGVRTISADKTEFCDNCNFPELGGVWADFTAEYLIVTETLLVQGGGYARLTFKADLPIFSDVQLVSSSFPVSFWQ